MRFTTGIASAALLIGGLTVTPLAGPAAAAPLSLSSIQDVVVDQAHGHVFVSGGALATTDLAATPTGNVVGVSAAKQMALTPDGSQLVVANGDGLTVVDASTATVLRTIATGPGSCPDAVAPAAGKMFFSYGDCAGGTPGLGAVDLTNDVLTKDIATGSVSLALDQGVALESVSSAPDMVVLRAGSTLAVLDATGGATPTVSVRVSKTLSGAVGKAVSVNPAGTQVVIASGSWSPVHAYSTVDLAMVKDYQVPQGGASAFRSDGRLALSPGKAGNVSTFGPSGSYLTSMTFLPRTASVAERGLAYGAERLYAGVTDFAGATPVYSLVRAPIGPPAALTIAADHTIYRYQQSALFTVWLQAGAISRSVKIYDRSASGHKTLLKTISVPSSTGKTTFHLQVTKSTYIRAEFAGDALYTRSADEQHINVRSRLTPSSASTSVTSDGYHRLRGSPAPLVTFTLTPYRQGACVQVSATSYVNGRWLVFSTSKCLYTTSNSRVSVRLIGFAPGRKITVSARAKATPTNMESLWVKYKVLIT